MFEKRLNFIQHEHAVFKDPQDTQMTSAFGVKLKNGAPYTGATGK